MGKSKEEEKEKEKNKDGKSNSRDKGKDKDKESKDRNHHHHSQSSSNRNRDRDRQAAGDAAHWRDRLRHFGRTVSRRRPAWCSPRSGGVSPEAAAVDPAARTGSDATPGRSIMNAKTKLVGGLLLLTLSAEVLIRGAVWLATRLGLSPLVVGLTVVAFGTSAPELAVSVMSAFKGGADLALGNVVGSNIINVLLILGLSAVIVPLVVAQGYDTIWFGILMIVLIEMALITPPVGLNLYVVQGARKSGSLNEVMLGALP